MGLWVHPNNVIVRWKVCLGCALNYYHYHNFCNSLKSGSSTYRCLVGSLIQVLGGLVLQHAWYVVHYGEEHYDHDGPPGFLCRAPAGRFERMAHGDVAFNGEAYSGVYGARLGSEGQGVGKRV